MFGVPALAGFISVTEANQSWNSKQERELCINHNPRSIQIQKFNSFSSAIFAAIASLGEQF